MSSCAYVFRASAGLAAKPASFLDLRGLVCLAHPFTLQTRARVSLSPALVAEYQTRLPDKKLLQAKLHEFYTLNVTGTP